MRSDLRRKGVWQRRAQCNESDGRDRRLEADDTAEERCELLNERGEAADEDKRQQEARPAAEVVSGRNKCEEHLPEYHEEVQRVCQAARRFAVAILVDFVAQ